MTAAAVGCAVVGLIVLTPVAPVRAASLTATATPTATCTPPCADPAAARLTLSETVDRPTATIGEAVEYRVTLSNSGSAPADAVVVDDLLAGDAGYTVRDGTSGTVNSFMGQPITTVTRLLAGHYRWVYATVDAGQTDIVNFSAVILAPRLPLPTRVVTMTLTSTASTPGTPPVSVTTRVPVPRRPSGGGVAGAATGVPGAGAGVDLNTSGYLVVGGLVLTLVGAVARRRDVAAAEDAGRRPARSR